MKIQDFIKRLRRRLKDEGNSQKYNDEEILAAINQEQNIIIAELDLNVRLFSKNISPEDNVLILPKIILKVVRARLNGSIIPLKNYKYALDEDVPEIHIMSYSDMQTLAVMPEAAANGKLQVWANICHTHEGLDEPLFLNDIFVDSLIFITIKNILQSENSELSIQKMTFYEQLFQKEFARIKGIVSNTRSVDVLYSKVSRI